MYMLISIIIIRKYSYYEGGSTGLFRGNAVQVSAFATSALTNISGKGSKQMFYIKMKFCFDLFLLTSELPCQGNDTIAFFICLYNPMYQESLYLPIAEFEQFLYFFLEIF